MTELTENIIKAIQAVPFGRVASYGRIAELAGNPHAARQVVRTLHTYSSKFDLPWHRILGSDGKIKLGSGAGLEEQASRLAGEDVELKTARNGLSVTVDLERYGV